MHPRKRRYGPSDGTSGASTGAFEAVELRDGADAFGGKGVQNAVNNVNHEIFETVAGMDASAQTQLDRTMIELDGTENKGRLGANAILGVAWQPHTPVPALRHATVSIHWGCERLHLASPDDEHHQWWRACGQSIDVQEFMIMPTGASTFREGLRWGAEIFQALKKRLKVAGHNTNVGDEGGFAPNLASTKEALDFVMGSIEDAGLKPGADVVLALDAASTEFYADGLYHLAGEGKKLDSAGMVDYRLIWQRPIRLSRSRTAWLRKIGLVGPR